MNYYDQELELVNNPASVIRLKLTGASLNGEDAKTKWINLNKDSIEALRRFLDSVESELENES